MRNNYPIPGCDAYVSLPNEHCPDTVCVDGNLTLADLKWLVNKMEEMLGGPQEHGNAG